MAIKIITRRIGFTWLTGFLKCNTTPARILNIFNLHISRFCVFPYVNGAIVFHCLPKAILAFFLFTG